MPARQPDYRIGRSHEQFLTNLPYERDDLRKRLADGWNVGDSPGSWPQERVSALVASRYGAAEWTNRR
jgi:lipoate-protein ligase A